MGLHDQPMWKDYHVHLQRQSSWWSSLGCDGKDCQMLTTDRLWTDQISHHALFPEDLQKQHQKKQPKYFFFYKILYKTLSNILQSGNKPTHLLWKEAEKKYCVLDPPCYLFQPAPQNKLKVNQYFYIQSRVGFMSWSKGIPRTTH